MVKFYWIIDKATKEKIGFISYGHALKGREGEDIVCAGISAILQTGIISLIKKGFDIDLKQEKGYLKVRILNNIDKNFINNLFFFLEQGLNAIKEKYGGISIKEEYYGT